MRVAVILALCLAIAGCPRHKRHTLVPSVPTDGDPTLTERFEYFAGGMELGNAFTEINDAAMQEERFEQQ